MTPSRSNARVFSGMLSHLMVNDVMAAGQLSHTYRDRPRDTPIRIDAEVLSKVGPLSEGPVALYGELKDGVLTVLGPDLRRSTLAAARPRGDMGPPAPKTVDAVLSEVDFRTAKATGKLYITGKATVGDETRTFIVRNPLAETLGENITDGAITVRGVVLGENFEILALA